ncbi:MAG: hypothetical protein WCJ29_03735 [bacterium]
MKSRASTNRCVASRLGERGQLLLEVLIVTTIAAAVIALTAQIVSVSLSGTRSSGVRGEVTSLTSEAFDGVRASATEKWQNLFNLATDGTHYYSTQSAGKWVLSAGDETVTIQGKSYTRYFTISSVSRDLVTRDIETSYNASHDDPSTRQITVTLISNDGATTTTSSEYVPRWRNKACLQTDWGVAGAGPTDCPTTNFGSKTNIDTSTSGSIKILQQ